MPTQRSSHARTAFDHVAHGAVLVLLCLGGTPFARGQDSSLEERLVSADPAVSGPAVKSVLAQADHAKPLLLV